MSDAYPKIKRVTTEVAAQTLSQFSPLDLYHTETRAIIDGNYHYPGDISQEDRERIRRGAIEYNEKLKRIRQEFGHKAMLRVMLDRTTNVLANGMYVDSDYITRVRLGRPGDPFAERVPDYSIDNWELSPDGLMSRGYRRTSSQETRQFGIWAMNDIKDAHIRNNVQVAGSGSYGYSFAEELSAHKEGDGFMLAYISHGPTDAIYRPFHNAFVNAPER